jgi:hypothetical protein
VDAAAEGVQAAAMDENKPPAESPRDDDRARFRAALERKARKHVDVAGHAPSAMHPHTAPAKPQKTFRRKSG